MKKVFVLAAVLCFTTSAFATKARLKALGNSMHLKDTQTVYPSPYHILDQENFIAIESGFTGATTVDNGAEGSILFDVAGSKMLASLGHLDETVQNQRRFLNATAGSAFKTQQNPVELLYGFKTDSIGFAFGAYYSNYNDKVAGTKENSSGVRVSASHGDFKWKVNLGLTNTATDGTSALNNQFTGDVYLNLGLRYNVNTLRYGIDVTTWGVKQKDNTDTENQSHGFQSINLRVVNVEKQANGEFFMGAGIEQVDVKNRRTDKKFSRLVLPVLMGVETQAADWLTLRMAVTQTVLVAQSKDEVGYTSTALTGATGSTDADFAAEGNNTVASVGAGLTYGKVNIDGTLKGLIGGAATQNVDSANLLAQVGLVYKY